MHLTRYYNANFILPKILIEFELLNFHRSLLASREACTQNYIQGSSTCHVQTAYVGVRS